MYGELGCGERATAESADFVYNRGEEGNFVGRSGEKSLRAARVGAAGYGAGRLARRLARALRAG